LPIEFSISEHIGEPALICLRCLYGHKPTQTPQNSAI